MAAPQENYFKEAAFGPWRTPSLQFYSAGRFKTVGTLSDVNTSMSTNAALECSRISMLVNEAIIPLRGRSTSLEVLKQTVGESEEKKLGEARLIELATFPGFNPEDCTPLPHGLAPSFIMELVTSNQIKFTTRSFKETWKAFFTSKPSECLMMDCFWWFFLHHYHPNQEVQDKLFCRMSTNYVKVLLGTEVSTHTKDVLLRIYPDCIAQCVYATFMHAFPNSWNSFDEQLRSNLCSTLYLWLGGVKPFPNGWEKWNTRSLEPRLLDKLKLAATENGHDLFGSHTQITTTSTSAATSYDVIQSHDSGLVAKEVTWAPEDASMSSTQSVNNHICYVQNKTSQPEESSQSMSGKGTTTTEAMQPAVMPLSPAQHSSKNAKTTAQVAAQTQGPELSHVMFDRCGHSPLVQLYLAQRHLCNEAGYSMLMNRTEVTRLPPTIDSATYQDVLMKSTKAAIRTYQQFDKLYHHQKEATRRAEARRKEAALQHNREVKAVLSSKCNVHQLGNEIAGLVGHKQLHTQDHTSKNAISAAISKIVKN